MTLTGLFTRVSFVACVGLAAGIALGWSRGDTRLARTAGVTVGEPDQPVAPAQPPSVQWTLEPRRIEQPLDLPRLPDVPPPIITAPRPEPAALGGAAATRGSAVDEALAAQPATAYARVEVTDASGFRALGKHVRFDGVRALAADDHCGADGPPWPCGRRAVTALRDLVRQRVVHCVHIREEGDEITARCRVGRTDLSAWLVEQGWAKPSGDDTRLTSLASEAQSARAGQFGPDAAAAASLR